MNMSLPAFIVILSMSLILVTRAKKDGAPLDACMLMTPGHPGTKPQNLSTAVHQIQFRLAPGSNSKKFTVNLGSKTNAAFKGFFIQARSPTTGNSNPVGTWDVSESGGLAKGVSCSSIMNSAATHVDNSAKVLVSLIWNPPQPQANGQQFVDKVVFVATVVQDFKTYWVGIQSEGLTLQVPGVPSYAASSLLATPTALVSSNSSPTQNILATSQNSTSISVTSVTSSPTGPTSTFPRMRSDSGHPLGAARDAGQQQNNGSAGTGSGGVGSDGNGSAGSPRVYFVSILCSFLFTAFMSMI